MTIAVHPSELRPLVEEALLMLGRDHVVVEEDALTGHPDWDCLLVDLGDQPARRLRLARPVAETGVPVVVIVPSDRLLLLEQETWPADFVIDVASPIEIRIRLARAIGEQEVSDELEHEDLILDLATYQATVGEAPIDLTYMEYELLRYFVEHKGRVWSREQILQQVWGYDYFGGARTVDVHVRRLRAKIGEERAHWITTVRSVGYRFG
ncbi:MAG: winged-helix domain-containing protein [Acidimicrobiia bacterium]|nr:winged-helix domain-containing protein [Acidimicrobiia bacterium]